MSDMEKFEKAILAYMRGLGFISRVAAIVLLVCTIFIGWHAIVMAGILFIVGEGFLSTANDYEENAKNGFSEIDFDTLELGSKED